MARVAFLAHLPLLRIEAEFVPFANGELWRMPLSVYDSLTSSAFDRPREYEATAPVFYRVIQELDLPFMSPRSERDESQAAQFKAPSARPSPSPLVETFQSRLVEPVWAALMLAAPASALPPPRLSCTFVVLPDNDVVFTFEGTRFTAIHEQGDADHEYLFTAGSALEPLGAEVLGRAAELVPRVEQLREVPDLAAALSALLSTCAPSLSRIEQLTLSVIALEALLLPEITTGLSRTLVRRGSALLATTAEDEAALGKILKMLYDLRSASVHGGNLRHTQDTLDAVRYGFAGQLLGTAIVELAERTSGRDLDAARSALDQDERSERRVGPPLPLAPPPAIGSSKRLLRPRTSFSTTFGGTLPSMAAPDGVICSWAPLIGLRTEAETRLGENEGGALGMLNGLEALALEEREARMDFMAPLQLDDHRHAYYYSALKDEDAGRLEEYTARLLRDRDLGVVALRLAGFTRFYDPELLGTFIYQGAARWRQPTVIRQTVMTAFRIEPSDVFHADGQRLTAPFVELLHDYDTQAHHPDVEHVLTMFRRTFDRRFLPAPAVAGLLFSTLEAMLGRFRPRNEPLQLETLVERIAGSGPAVDWFKAEGRALRNAVAHGDFSAGAEDDPRLEQLRSLLIAIIPAFLACWLETPDRGRARPATVFIESISG